MKEKLLSVIAITLALIISACGAPKPEEEDSNTQTCGNQFVGEVKKLGTVNDIRYLKNGVYKLQAMAIYVESSAGKAFFESSLKDNNFDKPKMNCMFSNKSTDGSASAYVEMTQIPATISKAGRNLNISRYDYEISVNNLGEASAKRTGLSNSGFLDGFTSFHYTTNNEIVITYDLIRKSPVSGDDDSSSRFTALLYFR
jgi:hypothetical protein